MKDPWEMFRLVLDERKKREMDPTLKVLRECVAEAEQAAGAGDYSQDRVRGMADFFEATTEWDDQVRRWPTNALMKFVKPGDKARKLLGLTG